MPMTVITLTSAPPKLRGDLTKWMQEISIGVYVGNFNSRVREKLWSRITESIGDGQATMSFSSRNELGYEFNTYNTSRVSTDFDGIPLVLLPIVAAENSTHQLGFSNASKFRKAKKFSQLKKSSTKNSLSYVVVDIETTGLDLKNSQIIEVGAVKIEGEGSTEFHALVKIDKQLPKVITDTTGITNGLLSEYGRELTDVMDEFREFIDNRPIVGYNVDFDKKFINNTFRSFGISELSNPFYDLMKFVKKEKMFLGNYKLETVLKAYKISESVPHRALDDAKLTAELAIKVNGFLDFLSKKS